MLCNISLFFYQIYFKVKLSLGAIEQQAGREEESWGPCWCCHGVTMLHVRKIHNAFPALKLMPHEFFFFFLVLWRPGVFFTKHQSRGYKMFAFKVAMLRTLFCFYWSSEGASSSSCPCSPVYLCSQNRPVLPSPEVSLFFSWAFPFLYCCLNLAFLFWSEFLECHL